MLPRFSCLLGEERRRQAGGETPGPGSPSRPPASCSVSISSGSSSSSVALALLPRPRRSPLLLVTLTPGSVLPPFSVRPAASL